MTKTKLETFIKKYSLGGNLDEVRWIGKDGKLILSEVTSDKKVLVTVELNNFDGFGDAEFVIGDTPSLKAKLAPLAEDIKINLNRGDEDSSRITSIEIEDDRNKVVYITGVDDHLPPKPKIINIPNYEVEIVLTPRFIDSFLKSKSGFNDVQLFTLVMSKKKNLEMVLGYSNHNNTDRIVLGLDCVPGKNTISSIASFSADILREILNANNDSKSDPILKVSEQGLAYVEFDVDGFNSKYYIVKTPVED